MVRIDDDRANNSKNEEKRAPCLSFITLYRCSEDPSGYVSVDAPVRTEVVRIEHWVRVGALWRSFNDRYYTRGRSLPHTKQMAGFPVDARERKKIMLLSL